MRLHVQMLMQMQMPMPMVMIMIMVITITTTMIMVAIMIMLMIIFFRFVSIEVHSRQCFIDYPTANFSNFAKNTPLHDAFSTLFSVFGYHDNTLSLVFDMLTAMRP